MAIAPDGDLGRRPMRADAADDPAQMAAHFRAGRRFARPQNDSDRASRGGVVNMNRKEAALVVTRIEQRQLLMAMRDIAVVSQAAQAASSGKRCWKSMREFGKPGMAGLGGRSVPALFLTAESALSPYLVGPEAEG